MGTQQQGQQTSNTQSGERQPGQQQDASKRQGPQTRQTEQDRQSSGTANEIAEDDSASINESSNQKVSH